MIRAQLQSVRRLRTHRANMSKKTKREKERSALSRFNRAANRQRAVTHSVPIDQQQEDRSAKVEQLRLQVQAGTYQVNNWQLAERLLGLSL